MRAIGWRQLFNGKFSKEWSHIQDNLYGTNLASPDQQKTGLRWQTKLILKIWGWQTKLILKIWEQWDDR
jgi:hypothetical protein